MDRIFPFWILKPSLRATITMVVCNGICGAVIATPTALVIWGLTQLG